MKAKRTGMKTVSWTDARGFERRSLLPEDEPDELVRLGVPQDPPDLAGLDWDVIQRELHNELVRRGLFTFDDVQRAQNGLTGAIRATLGKHLVALYRRGRREK